MALPDQASVDVTLRRYLLRKSGWYVGALLAAVFLNFLLPRLIPGNPVDAMVAGLAGGGAEGDSLLAIREQYVRAFGLDRSLFEQFGAYLANLLAGDFGVSFALYPAQVRELIGDALPWTIALQLPAILLGWLVGNVLGAIAAYRGGWFDRGAFLGALFTSSMPYYCLAIVLLYVFAVAVPVLPASGGYSFGVTPEFSAEFLGDALNHYWLPFLSLVIIFIGHQAVGMRSMAIYELGTDYVDYARSLGLADRTVVRYIFRNAALPQITGLALSIGTLVGGALITEIVFSYPGIGSLLFNAIGQNDYPVIAGITLVIAIAVLLANFCVDIAYGVIDPRIRSGGGEAQ